jgi:putative transcriptional regulator
MTSKILQGMRQAVAHARGEAVTAKVHNVEVDIRAIRQRLGLSQAEFALRFGFAPGSVRNWEQGHRQPQGPARVLLRVIDREPDAVQRALAAA